MFFAIKSGYKFIFFRLGSLTLIKNKDGNFKLKKFTIPGTLGQSLSFPEGKAYKEYNYKLWLYGGVIFNLIASFISLILLFMVESYGFKAFAFLFASVGLLLALTNGIPYSEYIDNDAMTIKKLQKYKGYREFIRYGLKINYLDLMGKSILDLDNDELTYILEKDYKYSEPTIIQGDYYLAKKDLEKAKEKYYLSLNKKLISSEIQNISVISELIYINALEGNKSECENLMTNNYKNMSKKFEKVLINTFYSNYAHELLINKNFKKGQKIKDKFEKFVKDYPFIGQIKAAKEKFLLIDNLASKEL